MRQRFESAPDRPQDRPFSIRPGVPADAPAIRRVHESSIRGLGPARYMAAEVESWVGVLTDQGYVDHMATGEIFLVAETPADGVVAFCSRQDDEVKALYVAPAWVGRGVGTALLALAEAAIAEAGHAKVRIGASLTGESFYTARGYVVVGRHLWTTRGGLAIASVDMERPLPGPGGKRS